MRKPIAGVCRFCGCTENAPCLETVHIDELAPMGFVPQGVIQGSEMVGCLCGWIDQDQNVCSNPACVERAYRAAVERAEARAA